MPDYLDHKDIDAIVEGSVEAVHVEYPVLEDWQQAWCIQVKKSELAGGVKDEIIDGGWLELKEERFSPRKNESYLLVTFAPTTNNEKIREWVDREQSFEKNDFTVETQPTQPDHDEPYVF